MKSMASCAVPVPSTRPGSIISTAMPGIFDKTFFTHYGDLTDSSNLNRILERVQPDEIYNLAAQSHVQVSFEVPEYTAEVDAIGTLRFLDAIKENGHHDPLLPGLHQRAVRQGPGDPTERNHALLPPLPLRGRPSSTATGSWSTTARPITSSPATASSSTTNPPAAARPSSPGRSPGPRPGSGSACQD